MLGSSYKLNMIDIRDKYDEPIISFSEGLNHRYTYIQGTPTEEGTSLYTLFVQNHVISIYFTNTRLSFSCKNKDFQEEGLQFAYDSKIKMCEHRIIKNQEEKEVFVTNLETQKIHIKLSENEITLECRDRKEATSQIKDGIQMEHNLLKHRIVFRQLSRGKRKSTHVLMSQSETNITYKKKNFLAVDDPEVCGIRYLLEKNGKNFSETDSLSVIHIRQYTPEAGLYTSTNKYYLNNQFIHGIQEKEQNGKKLSVAEINDQEQENGFVTRYKPTGKRVEYEYCNGNKIANFTVRNRVFLGTTIALCATAALWGLTKCASITADRIDAKPTAVLKINAKQHIREN